MASATPHEQYDRGLYRDGVCGGLQRSRSSRNACSNRSRSRGIISSAGSDQPISSEADPLPNTAKTALHMIKSVLSDVPSILNFDSGTQPHDPNVILGLFVFCLHYYTVF